MTGVAGTRNPAAGELWDRLRARVEPERLAWLVDAVEAVRADPATLATRFPAAGRHVGRGPLEAAPIGASGAQRPGAEGAKSGDAASFDLSAAPAAEKATATYPRALSASNGHEYGWTVDDAARVLLILAAGAGAGDVWRELDDVWRELDDLYRHGDAAERRGVLRSLAFLPGEGGLALVEDAIRTNDPRLLAAALDPYGLAHLDDEALDQAILKCVFVGVPLAALPRAALAERTRPALSRMLAAYVRERVAAGRDVPPDVWPLIEAHPPQDELAALRAELGHPVPDRRAAAAAALAQRTGGNNAHSGDQRHP